MRPMPVLLLVVGMASAASPALAVRRLDLTPHFPVQHQADARFQPDPDATPYAMNYTDEAAQTLGVSHGRWDAFDTKTGSSSNPYMPSLKGGIDGGGAMIRLQWVPGS